jgi:hypothetical protein
VGGGFRASRVGELVIGRTSLILKAEKTDIALTPIHNDPDQAGLIGAAHLAPAWMFEAYDAILGVDIGGTNIRAGVVNLNLKKDPGLGKAKVWKFSLWRHGDEEGVKREHALETLVAMLEGLIEAAIRKSIKLAPFIGIGCPGLIVEDGAIARGAQNLPGNWESSRFNLPLTLHDAIPRIGDHETSIVLHNDAVVQGLSEIPFMRDIEHWGVLNDRHRLGEWQVHQSRQQRKLKGGRPRRSARHQAKSPAVARLKVWAHGKGPPRGVRRQAVFTARRFPNTAAGHNGRTPAGRRPGSPHPSFRCGRIWERP